MQPFAGAGREQRGAVLDPTLDQAGALLAAVDDDRLLGRELEGVLAGHLLVDPGVEPDLGRTRPVLLSAVAVADDEILAGMGHVMLHRVERVPATPDPLRPREHLHRPVRPPHEGVLALLHDIGEHA